MGMPIVDAEASPRLSVASIRDSKDCDKSTIVRDRFPLPFRSRALADAVNDPSDIPAPKLKRRSLLARSVVEIVMSRGHASPGMIQAGGNVFGRNARSRQSRR